MKTSIYETITNQIIAAIEEGAELYKMPWNSNRSDLMNPCNASTGRNYRGLNIVTLAIIAEARQYTGGTWATYQQWQENGCQVRKGEKSASVFFWKNLNEEREAEQTDEEAKSRFVARSYNVFNADQVDGYSAPEISLLSEEERIVNAEAFFQAIPAEVMRGQNKACYIPAEDKIKMVSFSQFKCASAYYSVLAHELTHWSGAKQRLDRDLSGRFGSEAYAMEELVAELGAAFISGQLNLQSEPRRDHAPYIASWLKVLRNDPRAIFTAASKAQAAADYLCRFQSSDEEMAA